MDNRRAVLVPGIVAGIGLVLVIVGVVLTQSRDSALDLRPFTNGGRVTADSAGFVVYDSATADIGLPCTAVGPGGSVRLERPAGVTSVTSGGTGYNTVAQSPTSLAAGRYRIECASPSGSLLIGARDAGGTGVGGWVTGGGVVILVAALLMYLFRRKRDSTPGDIHRPEDARRAYTGPPPTTPGGQFGP